MKVGIIGAGAMGNGIAQVAAAIENTVKIYDADPKAAARASENTKKNLIRLVEKNKITIEQAEKIAQRITFTDRLEGLGDSELVIEAVMEDLTVKKTLFAELEMYVADTCMLATNTSSLSVSAIAAACRLPHRMLGIHFFNPPTLMKLVEIIPAVQTDPQMVRQAKSIIDSWGKKTVIAKDTPGFIVNKVARPFYSEALRIYDEGLATFQQIDDAMKTLGGFKMGPFELMDFIGHDVNFKVTESIFYAMYADPRYKPSFTQKRLLDAGFLGIKTRKGFYEYDHQNQKIDFPDSEKSPQHYPPQMIFERILAMLINEAADTCHFQIATGKDIDTAMKWGVNYPKGLLQWANEWGIENCVAQMNNLYDEYREDRYRCSPLLKRMGKNGTLFES